MAGDGGRVPDVSEQRAEVELAFWECGHVEIDRGRTHACDERPVCSATYRRAALLDDPASVLAALLAESPEATVSALEALLTSDEATRSAADVVHRMFCVDRCDRALEPWLENGRLIVSAAVRSLLSKAPKEDGDA